MQAVSSRVPKRGFKKQEVPLFVLTCVITTAYILEKLHHCCFFDDEIQPSIFFLTLHDAMLYIMEKHPESAGRKSDYGKVKTLVWSFHHFVMATALTTSVKCIHVFFVVLQITTSITVHNSESSFWRNDRRVCT